MHIINTTECPHYKYGKECASSCSCKEENTERCDKVDGTCTCKVGWEEEDCDQDVKECTIDPTRCGPNAKCHELLGSFKCTCNAGYMMDEHSVCKGKYQQYAVLTPNATNCKGPTRAPVMLVL